MRKTLRAWLTSKYKIVTSMVDLLNKGQSKDSGKNAGFLCILHYNEYLYLKKIIRKSDYLL